MFNSENELNKAVIDFIDNVYKIAELNSKDWKSQLELKLQELLENFAETFSEFTEKNKPS